MKFQLLQEKPVLDALTWASFILAGILALVTVGSQLLR